MFIIWGGDDSASSAEVKGWSWIKKTKFRDYRKIKKVSGGIEKVNLINEIDEKIKRSWVSF